MKRKGYANCFHSTIARFTISQNEWKQDWIGQAGVSISRCPPCLSVPASFLKSEANLMQRGSWTTMSVTSVQRDTEKLSKAGGIVKLA
jgi:hypothetical protein